MHLDFGIKHVSAEEKLVLKSPLHFIQAVKF